MSTNSRGEVSQFDFEELANQLLEQGLTASPADLHGCIAGLLAAGASHQAEAGLAALHQALDLDLDVGSNISDAGEEGLDFDFGDDDGDADDGDGLSLNLDDDTVDAGG